MSSVRAHRAMLGRGGRPGAASVLWEEQERGGGPWTWGPGPCRERSQPGYLCMDIAFYFNIFSIIVDI